LINASLAQMDILISSKKCSRNKKRMKNEKIGYDFSMLGEKL